MSSKDENSTELDSQKMKTDLIKFQILRAKDKFKSDNFDFVFVDDRKDILGAIKKMLESKPEWLPPKVRVALYYYNWHASAQRPMSIPRAIHHHPKVIKALDLMGQTLDAPLTSTRSSSVSRSWTTVRVGSNSTDFA